MLSNHIALAWHYSRESNRTVGDKHEGADYNKQNLRFIDPAAASMKVTVPRLAPIS